MSFTASLSHLGKRFLKFCKDRVVDVFQAIKCHNVLIGLLGTILITLGSLTPAYLPSNSPIWRAMAKYQLHAQSVTVVGTLLVLAGVGLLVYGWFKMRPLKGLNQQETAAYLGLKHWAVLGIWGLPFYLAPPIFSHDAYSYAAQGWLLHNFIDPYQVGPGILPGTFADQVAWVWRFTPAPYGPLSLRISQWLVEMCGFSPYWSAIAQRIPALVGVGLIGFFIPRIASRMKVSVADAAWFATLNPLVVIDFIGGAHNDSLMMGLVILGIWVAFKSRILVKNPATEMWWILGAAIIGVGASIKQPALMAAIAVPLISRPWFTWKIRDCLISISRILLGLGVSVGVFALVSIATGLDFGWYNAIDVPGKVITVSPFTLLGQAVQYILNIWHLDPTGHMATTVSRSIGMVIGGIFVVWYGLTVGRTRPIKFLAWAYIAVALCAPALHSWYMLWGGLLLPLTKPGMRVIRASVWSTVILLCYATVNLSWRNNALAYGIVALVAFWWLVTHHHAHARKIAAKIDSDEKNADMNRETQKNFVEPG